MVIESARGFLYTVLISGIILFVLPYDISDLVPSVYSEHQTATGITSMYHEKKQNISEAPVSMLFVGDVMLGRGVETLIEQNGIEYPFQHVREFILQSDVVVGNFEGVVQKNHTKTLYGTLQFSIREEYLEHLKNIGFEVLSLANNHSFDYGKKAYQYTMKKCEEMTLVCGGSPYSINTQSIDIIRTGSSTFGYIFINTTFGEQEYDDIKSALKILRSVTDMQIALVHWGNEYDLVHNSTQEKLAYILVDAGVDLVIGHHPHVIQDVEIYKNSPIFYSLGNFIFDQYFSPDVEIGLAVQMNRLEESTEYKLIPHTSIDSNSSPKPMSSQHEAQRIFERILGNIKDIDSVDVSQGKITIKN